MAHHNEHSERLKPREASDITSWVSVVSVCVALTLVGLKAGAWYLSGSVALLSSLADSGLDLAASIVTLIAVRYAAVPPDADHRYGHGKAEAFAGLFQAGLVAVSAVLIGIEATSHLLNPVPVTASGIALGVMALSIALTGALITLQSWALRKTRSVATAGDRAHYASDLAANIAVMVGIGASVWLHVLWADAVAGLLVAAWLAWGALGVAKGAADHLMDREMSNADRARIKALALQDPALKGVHDLRTRLSGPYVHVQFHADVAPTLSLKEAHAIVVAAEKRIRAEFPAADILIHPDPMDAAEPHGHEDFSEGKRQIPDAA